MASIQLLERLERLAHLLVAPRGLARLLVVFGHRRSSVKLVDPIERRSVADADEYDNEEYISGHSPRASEMSYSIFSMEKVK